jgi:hypothetical protein
MSLIRECNRIFNDQKAWKAGENKTEILSRIKTLFNRKYEFSFPVIPKASKLIEKIIKNPLQESPKLIFPRIVGYLGNRKEKDTQVIEGNDELFEW